ncbi:MAG: hypothetical protein E7626_01355 [Ruminococcaceae bacterium]|nr:hypothetical protein [Oscillospiraceae bacterium]
MKYLTIDEIKQAFADHLMKYRGYSPEEADMAVSDFPDPYSNCYLNEEYIGHCEIDGVAYEQNASSTVLWRVGIPNVPDFFFYTYYREEDIESRTVGSYMNARKLFRVDDLDAEDFPEEFKKKRNNKR